MAPSLSLEDAVAEIRGLEDALSDRIGDIEKWQKYYNGEHSLKYASEDFREWFQTRFAGFADNWCLPTDSPVVTSNGVKPVDKIDVGDKLPTHGGESVVERVFVREVNEDIVNLRTYGSAPVRITGNHPILASRRNELVSVTAKYATDHHFRVYGAGAEKAYRRDSVAPEWVRADELTAGDIVWSAAPEQATGGLSSELMALLGWYVAEGSVSDNGRIAFSLHSDETAYADEIEHLLTLVCGLTPAKRMYGPGQEVQVVAYSKSWVAKLTELAGRGCAAKRLNEEAMASDARAFLRSSWLGDGTAANGRYGKLSYTTVSLDLAVQMQHILLREGMTPSWRTSYRQGRRTAYHLTLAGGSAKLMADLLGGEVDDTRWSKSPSGCFVNGMVGYAVAEVGREHYNGYVYDLQVAESHSFTLPGCFTVHNCAPVADATTERMAIAGIRLEDEVRIDEDLYRDWQLARAPIESHMAFTTSAICARSFAIVWADQDGEPTVSFEHPSQCIVGYEPGSRWRRKNALRMWEDDEDSKVKATLYRPEGLYKVQKPRVPRQTHGRNMIHLPPNVHIGDWEPRTEDGESSWFIPNPLGEVPMVELQNKPSLDGDPLSEIGGVAAMQDAINALWSYLFTAADFAALPQKVVLGAQLPKMPVLDDQGRKVGTKPVDLPEANIRRILAFEGEHAKIDQWDSADLENFLKVMQRAVTHVANQTRTPLYYFVGEIANISGDTLKALDTGHNFKIGDRKLYYDDPIKEIFALIALVRSEKGKADAVRAGKLLWHDHEARSDSQKYDKLTKLKTLGFPFEYLVELEAGGDASEVQRIMDMRKDEAENDPLSPLNMQQRQLDMAEEAANDLSQSSMSGPNGQGGNPPKREAQGNAQK